VVAIATRACRIETINDLNFDPAAIAIKFAKVSPYNPARMGSVFIRLVVTPRATGCQEIDDWLDWHRASFETAALQLPQDEIFSII
jgi:hypothetical protein